jgi:hypothetical protein
MNPIFNISSKRFSSTAQQLNSSTAQQLNSSDNNFQNQIKYLFPRALRRISTDLPFLKSEAMITRLKVTLSNVIKLQKLCRHFILYFKK